MDGFVLKSLFILNTNIKPKLKKASEDEIQDAKILFYYPKNEDVHVRRSNCGIIEGALGFLECFEKNENQYFVVELSNFYYISNKFDENINIVFLLQKQQENIKDFSIHQNFEVKKEFFKMILNNYYETLILFHGKMSLLFEITSDYSNDIRNQPLRYNQIISILSDFTESYFEGISVNKLPIIDNLLYFPLSNFEYIEIMMSVQRLFEKLTNMRYCSIIYKGFLIHNEIPLDYMAIIYNTFYNNIDSSSKYLYFNRPNFKMIETLNYSEQSYIQDIKIESNMLSNYRKCFEVVNSNQAFLMGIQKLNVNNYHLFMPTIYFQSKNENLKLLVYYYEGLMVFIFLNENFNINRKIQSVLKIEKWIHQYFKNHLVFLDKLLIQMSNKIELFTYFYMNGSNRSMKFSSNFFKKEKQGENTKYQNLFFVLKNNFQNKFSSLTNLKHSYLYYNFSLNRKIIMFLNHGETSDEIETAKRNLFDKILIF